MTYEFTTDKVGKVTLNNFGSYGNTFTLHGVDAKQSDADIIIDHSTTTHMNLK